MTERDYSNLTPEQLQAEFGGLIEQLPIHITEYDDKLGTLPGKKPFEGPIFDSFKRRQNSEHLQKFLIKAKNLLQFSPTSSSFKEHVLGQLEVSYLHGKQHEEKEIFDYWVLDEDGGIFKQPRAMEIEQNEYRLSVLVTVAIDESFDEIVKELNGQANDPKERKPDKSIVNWRQEFIELYGEEP